MFVFVCLLCYFVPFWPVAMDELVSVVCQPVACLCCAKVAEHIKVMFGMEILGDPRYMY